LPKLVVAGRNNTLTVFTLGPEPITLGREPENELQIDGLEVSRRHSRIEPLPKGGYRIIDLDSKNGTFLNGRQITAMALEYDDLLRLGDAMLVYIDDETDPEKALGRAGDGTFWNPGTDPASTEDDNLLDGDSKQGVETWRNQQRRELATGPHTRSSNRSYLKERLLRLGLLTQNIASAPDLRGLIETILDEVLDFTGFERGLLLLSDEERTDAAGKARMNPVLGRNMDHEHLDDIERRFSKGLVEEALTKKRITFRAGLANSDDSFSIRESVVSMGLESALCIPLTVRKRLAMRPGKKDNKDDRRRRKSRNRVLGAIYLDSTSPIRPLDKADLKLLEMVAAQAAVALHNARLHHQATTDPLTGLHNRAAIRQVFDEELRLAREHNEPLAVLLLDLDHFKRVNDTYGHDVGDEVLKRAAQRIRRSIRRDDFAARWGGEEFLLVLPSSDLEGALTVADKVSRALKSQPIGEDQIQITVSTGVAIFGKHGTTQSQLIKHADQALYAAKAAGRDRAMVFHPDQDVTGHRVDPFEGLFDGDPARTQRNLKAVFETLDLLRSGSPPREILDGTLDNVCDLTRARRAMLIVEDDKGRLRIAAGRRQGGRRLPRDLREYSTTPVRLAIDGRRSLCMLDTVGDGLLSSSSIDKLGLNTVMAVPLKVGDDVLGVLYADDTTVNREFSDTDLSHLELLAHQLALSVSANPRLFEELSGRTEERETARLRDEVSRLKAELQQVLEQTRQFKVSELRDPPS
jgi:diguanylate cyclase (GGDEF)-like protein